jgi:hypothetical protein
MNARTVSTDAANEIAASLPLEPAPPSCRWSPWTPGIGEVTRTLLNRDASQAKIVALSVADLVALNARERAHLALHAQRMAARALVAA